MPGPFQIKPVELSSTVYSELQENTLKGQSVKFKHQPAGAKDRPRFPSYLGLRKD